MFFLVLISNCLSVLLSARISEKKCFVEGINLCEYGSHEELLANLESLQENFPSLVRTGSIGRSVLGKELGYIVIREGLLNCQMEKNAKSMINFFSRVLDLS